MFVSDLFVIKFAKSYALGPSSWLTLWQGLDFIRVVTIKLQLISGASHEYRMGILMSSVDFDILIIKNGIIMINNYGLWQLSEKSPSSQQIAQRIWTCCLPQCAC